jgi:hypothetical protein
MTDLATEGYVNVYPGHRKIPENDPAGKGNGLLPEISFIHTA